MQNKEYEMPDEYKQRLEHLAGFLDARERHRELIREGVARGVRVSAADKALMDEKLREFDVLIDSLEKALAAEYDGYQAEKASEAEISAKIAKADDATKRLYIIIKHQSPHLLESFTECLDPLTPDEREQF
ncbi:MAG: hypothetical protein ABL959_24405, partial [Pyrinomonadaceae bacterium]